MLLTTRNPVHSLFCLNVNNHRVNTIQYEVGLEDLDLMKSSVELLAPENRQSSTLSRSAEAARC